MKKLSYRHALMLCISFVISATVSQQANANLLWDWRYSATDIAAAGTFTTTDTADSNGFYSILAISGERNGVAITGLQPAGTAIPGNDGYPGDDLVSLTNGQLTLNGFGYATADGYDANPYYNSNVYFEVYTSNSGNFISELPVSFSANIVPEPEMLVLMVTGLAVIRVNSKFKNV